MLSSHTYIILTFSFFFLIVILVVCMKLYNAKKRIMELESQLTASYKPVQKVEEVPPVHIPKRTDEEWLALAKDMLDKHIEDIDFNIIAFAHLMGMGKTSFGKKMKRLTGLTPNNYVISYKLNKAVEIMRENPHVNINEISYMLNFSSPSYFTKQFKEHFGQTPTAFRQTL